MGNKQANPLQTTANVWWIITAASVLAIFIIPQFISIKIYSGGVAIASICILLAIIGIIVAIIYTIRAKRLDRILKEDNPLAHWTYSPDEWQQYTEEEYTRQKAGKKTMFIIIAIATLVIGFGYWIFKPTVGQWVFIAMAGVIALTGFLTWFFPYYNHRQNKNSQGQAFFTSDAIYINRRLHDFKVMGSKLETIEIKGEQQKYIEFIYSIPGRHGRQRQEARVPIPSGKEDAARGLVAKYNQ
ncbi:MAG: hypothetical protein NT177_07675 [Chloroflexi bacterium]|jgi:uncharacterized membrane protein (DUF485 family)|nr:hypothetical protein [Chloroflexota bacterium]